MSSQMAEHHARRASNAATSDQEALREVALAIMYLAQAVKAIEAKVAKIK